MFFETLLHFLDDFQETFPHFQSEIHEFRDRIQKIQSETADAQISFVTEYLGSWQHYRSWIASCRDDLLAQPDFVVVPKIAFDQVWQHTSAENKQVIWKYLQSLLVYGNILMTQPEYFHSPGKLKERMIQQLDAVPEDAWDSKKLEEETDKFLRFLDELDKECEGEASKEIEAIKGITRQVAKLLTDHANTKNFMKIVIQGDRDNEEYKQMLRKILPSIQTLKKQIQRGELKQENFKLCMEKIIQKFGSGLGATAPAGEGTSEGPSSNNLLSDLLSTFGAYNFRAHQLPDLPDLNDKPKPAARKRRKIPNRLHLK